MFTKKRKNKKTILDNEFIKNEEFFEIEKIFNKVLKKKGFLKMSGFDPNQPRDDKGRWTDGGVDDMTDSEIEKEYDRIFGGLKPENKTEQEKFIDIIKKRKIEILGVFCGDKLLDTFEGNSNSVTYTTVMLDRCSNGYTTIHNHPSGNTVQSFADLWNFIDSEDAKMIITIPNGEYLTITKIGDYSKQVFGIDGKSEMKMWYNTIVEESYYFYKDKLKEWEGVVPNYKELSKRLTNRYIQQELIKHPYINGKIKIEWKKRP
jgi:hypothetical protein